MDGQAADGRKKPVILISLFVVLLLLTVAAVGGVSYGFYTGWLTPYWVNLSDAHAAVLAQLIFFFGAAWAAVLVPLLFGEQLQNLQVAADRAEKTYAEIEATMKKTAEESEAQFKKIVRLQMMSVGYLPEEQLEFLQTADERNDFVDTRWEQASVKLDAAIARIHGSKKNSINACQRRSNDWWQRIKDYTVLGEFHDDFRTLSDKARKNKNNLDIEDLRASNNASKRIESFDPTQGSDKLPTQRDGAGAQAPTISPSMPEPPPAQLQ